MEVHVKDRVNRCHLSGFLFAIAAAFGIHAVSAGPLRAQERPAAPRATGGTTKPFVQLRTPWGHPDLQGVWNNSTTTELEQRSKEEMDQGRRAGAAVRAATDGTGAAYPEIGRPLTQKSLIVDPPDGRIRMTQAAVDRLVARENARANRGESDSWLDRNSWERCISRGMPTAMIPNLYNANYQIFQTPDTVAILVEMIHDVRIIHLDGRPHVSQNIRGWMGDSRGRWEGDTLVVETTNFHDRMDGGPLQPSHVIQTGYRGSGETMKLVERFTRIDANTIDYRFTVEDPVVLTRPYTVSIPMRKDNAQDRIYEYACHEGNYGIVNILSAGRADEAGALEAARLVRQQRIDGGHPGIREPAAPIVPLPKR
jgi:hypothetical protein